MNQSGVANCLNALDRLVGEFGVGTGTFFLITANCPALRYRPRRACPTLVHRCEHAAFYARRVGGADGHRAPRTGVRRMLIVDLRITMSLSAYSSRPMHNRLHLLFTEPRKMMRSGSAVDRTEVKTLRMNARARHYQQWHLLSSKFLV